MLKNPNLINTNSMSSPNLLNKTSLRKIKGILKKNKSFGISKQPFKDNIPKIVVFSEEDLRNQRMKNNKNRL